VTMVESTAVASLTDASTTGVGAGLSEEHEQANARATKASRVFMSYCVNKWFCPAFGVETPVKLRNRLVHGREAGRRSGLGLLPALSQEVGGELGDLLPHVVAVPEDETLHFEVFEGAGGLIDGGGELAGFLFEGRHGADLTPWLVRW
jgi:hypothetical protein